jgi:hypothetical protein
VNSYRAIEVLGVDERAGPAAVRRAYVQLAAVFAPDRWNDDELRTSAMWWRDLVDAACLAAGQMPLPEPGPEGNTVGLDLWEAS